MPGKASEPEAAEATAAVQIMEATAEGSAREAEAEAHPSTGPIPVKAETAHLDMCW
jgi:hypothetical protein